MRIGRLVVTAAVVVTSACAGGGGRADGAPPQEAPGAPSSTSTTTKATIPPGPPILASPAAAVPPATALEAATRIADIERALRNPATPATLLPTLGWQQQVIYRALARNPSWTPEVLAAVPSDIAVVVSANVGGNTSIAALVEPPSTLPGAWRIVTPPNPEILLGFYREAEAASGIPWEYLAAINLVETRMGRIVGDSSAGAQGPMQFIPSSWRAHGRGGDVYDPRDAILAAGRYLAVAGGPADMAKAVFAYNHSSSYVDAVTRYASVMAADERAYLGYYHWQVSYRTVEGFYLLPEGYPQVAAVRLG